MFIKHQYIAFCFVILAFVVSCKCINSTQKKDSKPNYKDYNILLISLDTLSARHLPIYGYNRNTSPFLSRFAEESFVFNSAF